MRRIAISLSVITRLLAACGSYSPTLAPDGGPADGPVAVSDAGADGGAVGDADLTLDPDGNDFGDVLVGSTSLAAHIVVTNVGAGATASLSTTLTEGDVADFAITADGCQGTALAASASCAIDVVFTPGTEGAHATSLLVAGSPGGQVAAALTGNALAAGVLAADIDGYDFGPVKVSTPSAMRGFVFSNTGDVDTGALAVTSSNPSVFAIDSDGCTDQVLAPAAVCTVAVRFTPGDLGSATGSLTVSGDPGGNAVVALGGTGFAVVTIARSGSGSGAVASTPSGVDCGAVCQAAFTTAAVNLTATAAGGSLFSGWSDDCSGTGACAIDLDGGDAVVTARFEAVRSLTVTRAGGGGGSVTSAPAGIDCGADCADTYLDGTMVTLTASPAVGSRIASWNGCDSATAGTCTVTMSGSRAVTATFELESYGVTVSKTGAGGGTISSAPAGISCGADCTESWSYGASVVLTAVPAAGSSFSGWSGCDSASGTTCTLTITAARTVAADFDLQSFTLSAAHTGTGTGTITSNPGGITCGGDCSESYLYGTTVTLTAGSGAGSAFTGWTGCDTTAGSTCTVTVNGAESVSAAFTLQSYSFAVALSGGGSGSVASSPAGISCGADCSQTWAYGTSVTLTATPAAGSTFAGWSGCDASSGTSCTVTVNGVESVGAAFEPQGFTLGVTRTGTGTGTVTSSPAGISCGSDCSNGYGFGTVVTLTPTAATGSTFSGWTGCDSVSGTTCTVTINGDEAVTAQFTLDSYLVAVNRTGAGSGTVASSPAGVSCGTDCSESWAYGTTVTLTATPAAGSTFTGWSGCPAPAGTLCVITVSGAANLSAAFAPATPALAVNKLGNGSGTVSSSPAGISCGADCSESYAYGTSVTLTAAPGAGSVLSGWSGCDSVSGGSCTVAMTSARTVTATFQLTVHTLSVSKAGNGSGAVTSSPAGVACGSTCSATWNYGTAVTLTATAAGGSTFAGWLGCDQVSGTTCTVTVDGSEAVTATFALQSHLLTAGKSGNGAGTVTSNPSGIACGATCSASWDHGTAVTLTAAAAPGSSFTGWSGCDSVSGATCSVTLDAARTVTAGFALDS
ncbi:MAG TPA: choice-of-anchor D domain-containing protein, partial [Kofleriaceae bacterium]|nr:choice-of-anchor D domain-containing protein [Kofleriaceae bacterium]